MAESRCACPRFVTRRECVYERYSTSRGYDPEDVDILTDDECECPCHDEQDEYDEWEEPNG